jgi:hypothetical protein
MGFFPSEVWTVQEVPPELDTHVCSCLVRVITFKSIYLHIRPGFPPLPCGTWPGVASGFLVEGERRQVYCSGHQVHSLTPRLQGGAWQTTSRTIYVISNREFRKVDERLRFDEQTLSGRGQRVVAFQTAYGTPAEQLARWCEGEERPRHLDAAILHIEAPLKGSPDFGLTLARGTVSAAPGTIGFALGYGGAIEGPGGEVCEKQLQTLCYSAYTAPDCGHIFHKDAGLVAMPFLSCDGLSGGPVLAPVRAVASQVSAARYYTKDGWDACLPFPHVHSEDSLHPLDPFENAREDTTFRRQLAPNSPLHPGDRLLPASFQQATVASNSDSRCELKCQFHASLSSFMCASLLNLVCCGCIAMFMCDPQMQRQMFLHVLA